MRHARGGKRIVRFIAHHASVAEQGSVGYARAFRGKVMRKHIFGVHPYPFVKGGRMFRRYGNFRQHFRCVISQPVFILRPSLHRKNTSLPVVIFLLFLTEYGSVISIFPGTSSPSISQFLSTFSVSVIIPDTVTVWLFTSLR